MTTIASSRQNTPTLQGHLPGQSRIEVLAALSNPADRKALERILARTNWRVTFCSAVDRADRLASRHADAVILCDSHVPRLSLLELVASGRAVILTSDDEGHGFWASAIHAGAFDVLPKPFVAEEVLWTVSAAWHQLRHRGRKERHAGS